MNKTVNKIYTEAKAFNDTRQKELDANNARISELADQLEKMKTDSEAAVKLKDFSLFRKSKQTVQEMEDEIAFLEARNEAENEPQEGYPEEWRTLDREYEALKAEALQKIQKHCTEILKIFADADEEIELMRKAKDEVQRKTKTKVQKALYSLLSTSRSAITGNGSMYPTPNFIDLYCECKEILVRKL